MTVTELFLFGTRVLAASEAAEMERVQARPFRPDPAAIPRALRAAGAGPSREERGALAFPLPLPRLACRAPTLHRRPPEDSAVPGPSAYSSRPQ